MVRAFQVTCGCRIGCQCCLRSGVLVYVHCTLTYADMTVKWVQLGAFGVVEKTSIPVMNKQRAQNLISIPPPCRNESVVPDSDGGDGGGGMAAAHSCSWHEADYRCRRRDCRAERSRLPHFRNSRGRGNLPRPAGRPELPGSRLHKQKQRTEPPCKPLPGTTVATQKATEAASTGAGDCSSFVATKANTTTFKPAWLEAAGWVQGLADALQ